VKLADHSIVFFVLRKDAELRRIKEQRTRLYASRAMNAWVDVFVACCLVDLRLGKRSYS
jgi:hypothetical protein